MTVDMQQRDAFSLSVTHSNVCGTESVDYPVVYRGYDNIGNYDDCSEACKGDCFHNGNWLVQEGQLQGRGSSSGGVLWCA